MSKIRAAILTFATVFALGIAGAPPASALGDTCGTWSHASKSGTACVFISDQVTGTSARVTFSFSGNQSNNCIGFDLDYVRLVQSNGTILKARETNSGPSCVGQTFSTGLSFTCASMHAVARYRFRHSVGGPGFLWDGHTSGWIVRSTGNFFVCP